MEEVPRMKINPVGQSVHTQQTQRKGRKADAPPAKQKGDKVEISSDAKKLQDTNNFQTAATKAIQEIPDIREDKITEIRQKIADGFYDQENIAFVIADKLLKEFGI